SSLECRLALLDKRLGRFLVIGGFAGPRVMNRFAVETSLQRHGLGIVDVALDEAERDRWPVRQRHRQLPRGFLDLGIRRDLGDHAEIESSLRGQNWRQEIEFARLRAAEQLGQEIGAAVVAGEADLGEGGGDLAGRARHPEIARQRDREARAGRRAIELRHHGLWHLMQDARDLHALAQVGKLGLERQRRAAPPPLIDAAADTEGAAGPLYQSRAPLVIVGRAPRRLDEATRHVWIERVTAIRTVHGDGEQAAVEVLQDDFVCAHGGWLSLLLVAVVPGRREASNLEPRDSPMRNRASVVWSYRTIPE